MTLFRRTAATLFIAALGSCSNPTTVATNGFLTGTWETNSPGGVISMTLSAGGGVADGTVLEICCGTEGVTSTGTVTGTYGGGGFTLNVQWPDYEHSGLRRVTWVGHLTRLGTADELLGSWSETAPLDTVWGTVALMRVTRSP